jgi:TraY domain
MMDFSHGQNRVPVNVRVPVDLYQKLVAEAERSVRTVSSEIVFRLRESLEEVGQSPSRAERAKRDA